MTNPPKRPVGRPKAQPTSVIRLRLPVDAHTSIVALGGDKWAKRVLIEALAKQLAQSISPKRKPLPAL